MIEEYNEQIAELRNLNEQGRYFETILIGVQLLVKMADYISETFDDLGQETDQDYMSPKEYRSWSEVRRIYHKSLRKIRGEDAPRAKVLEVIYEIVNCTGFEHISQEEAISFMHKAEEVVSFRNHLAHEYFDGGKSEVKQLPIKSQQCLELIDTLKNHPLL